MFLIVPSAIKMPVPGTKQLAFLYGITFGSEQIDFQVLLLLSHEDVKFSPVALFLIVPSVPSNEASAACIITAEKYKKSLALGATAFKFAATFSNLAMTSGSARTRSAIGLCK